MQPFGISTPPPPLPHVAGPENCFIIGGTIIGGMLPMKERNGRGASGLRRSQQPADEENGGTEPPPRDRAHFESPPPHQWKMHSHLDVTVSARNMNSLAITRDTRKPGWVTD